MSYEITKAKFLSEAEVKDLQETLRLCSIRERVAFGLLLNLGMRGCELLSLRVEDVDLEQKVIHVPGKKGSKARVFPIPELLLKDLSKYVSGVTGPRLIDLSRSGLKLAWSKIRPSRKGLHSLRHTFAIQLFKVRRDIKLVQTCLGHRSIQNTMVYADYVYSREEVSRALGQGLFGGANA